MQDDTTRRRSYGTGSLYTQTDRNGVEAWYGKWRQDGRQIKRRLGLKRAPGRAGLTQTQAEAKLREQIGQTQAPRAKGERLSVAQAAHRYLVQSKRRGRKRSTMQNVESEVRVHLIPFFGDRPLDAITPEQVDDLVAVLEGKRLAPKTVRNIVATLSALFTFAKAPARRWAATNPCDGVELPAVPEAIEIRFLTLDEVRLLIDHAPRGMFREIDRAMWLTAAMTGLRKGELVALRWRDIDWTASRIRVRQNFVRGEFGSPKSKRSTRSVPMADDVGGVLDRLSQGSRHTAPDDLVFAHPATGGPLTKANITRRLRTALRAAGLDEAHVFHDLRHTFGTRVAAVGTPMRTLQEWMGHRDIGTTQRYADYAPSGGEAGLIAAAFARPGRRGTNEVPISADLSGPQRPEIQSDQGTRS
jgi:integrase